jgi:hypothetical protein
MEECVCVVEPTSIRFNLHVAVIVTSTSNLFFCSYNTIDHYTSTPCLGKSDSLYPLTPRECIWSRMPSFENVRKGLKEWILAFSP